MTLKYIGISGSRTSVAGTGGKSKQEAMTSGPTTDSELGLFSTVLSAVLSAVLSPLESREIWAIAEELETSGDAGVLIDAPATEGGEATFILIPPIGRDIEALAVDTVLLHGAV